MGVSEAAGAAAPVAVGDHVPGQVRAFAAAPRRRASAAAAAAGVAGSAAQSRQVAAAAATTRAATSTAVPSSAGAAPSVTEASSAAPAISTAEEASAAANTFITPTKVGAFDYGDTVLSTYVDQMYEFYMEEEVNERMRAILVDWLVDVHTRYRQHPETFYLSVSILDRFLERADIPRRMLQLFGATAMLIASKFCESFRREMRVDELVYLCDQTYSPTEIRNAERTMLSVLDFRVGAPTPFIFLSRIMRVARANTETSLLASYLAERMQQEYRMLRYRPSAVAAAAANIALRTFQGADAWTTEIAEAAGYDVSSIKYCIRDMENCLTGAPADEAAPVLGAVDRKYSSARYGEVALIPRAALSDDGAESNAE